MYLGNIRGIISDFSWGGGGGQRRLGERSESNQWLGEGVKGGSKGGGAVNPPREKSFDFELFYVLFEATQARYFSKY